MKIADLIRSMTAAGAPPEAIAIAVEAIEAGWAKDEERRAKQAARKAKSRAGQERDSHGTVTGQSQPPSPSSSPSFSSPEPPPITTPLSALSDAGSGARGGRELGPWLASLVGTHPVAADANLQPIRELLDEGFTLTDIEAGVREALERGNVRFRWWRQLAGWIRVAGRDQASRLRPRPNGRAPPNETRNPHAVLLDRHLAELP